MDWFLYDRDLCHERVKGFSCAEGIWIRGYFFDVRKNIQSGKSTWSILQSEVKAHLLRVLERRGMIKVVKRTRTHAQFRAPFYGFGAKILRFCLRNRENAKFKIFKIKYI